MADTKTHKVTLVPGDGIGPEVTRHAVQVAGAAAALADTELQWTDFPWGTDYYFANQRMAPPDFLDQLVTFDAILLGAVGHPVTKLHRITWEEDAKV